MDREAFVRYFSYVVSQDRLKQGLEVIAEFRREVGGHKIKLSVSVMQPICID